MGPEFEYELTANGLQTNTEYSLIYYADEPDRFNNWGGDNPGALIVEATSDSNGNLVVSGSVDLGMNLPSYPDANMDINEHDYCGAPDFYSHCTGAKIWLVPSSDYSEPGLTAWNPNNYLFETDLIDYNFAECYWVRDHVTEINLSCMDPQPHPVGYGEACFRISFDIAPWLTNRVYCPLLGGTMQGPNDDDYCCVDEGTIIIFQEDSLHGLEFYCVDALENRNNQTDLEYFRVDSIPPIINKTLIGPQYGDCPPRPGTNDTCWIKDWTCEENGTGTTIHVEAYDNNTYENCTVGNVTCDWMYYLDGNPMKGESNKIPPFDIRFYEDTVHELEIVCRDALGNNIEDIETFYVDSQPPLTNKTYGDPQKIEPNCEAMCISQCIGNPVCFEDCTHALCTIWINSSTPITLNATDNPQAPCASGVNNTYWRNTVVSDNYCYDVVTCDEAQGMGNWTEYTGQFYKPEESCHLIEYFSVDNLGIEEEIKKQCVFVDNTPPRGNKTVGEPKIACNGSEFNITTNGGMLAPRVQGINPVTLYVIADNSKQPNLLEAYNVETNGTLTYVSNYTLPTVGNGAVGTALDTVNDQLFVTFEFIGDVYVFDANNFNPMGNISTAASDLAGVFVDETQGYLYVADRNGPNVHVYDTTTHANVITYNTGLNIYGMAFDHNNNKIYVTDGSTTVREYNTTMNLLNTYSLPNNNVGIAVDTRNQADVYLYTTTWYYSPSSFTKYRINNGVSNQSATMDDPAGIAVHPTAAFTYVTSGDPGLHDLKAYNTNTMTEIQNTIMPGTATDLFVGEVIFVPYCGDSKLDSGEECDDGNTENGDGCDENCQIEYPAGPDCWWVRDHVTEITLDCEDQGDHPVEQETMCYRVSYDNVSGIWGYITNQYCTEFGGTMEGDWCCNYVGDEPYVFNFTEDSVHDLEFYCIDHLGNTEETTDLEYFKVDSVAPNTTKTYLEPYYVNPQTGFDYIDNASRIELTAVDGGDVCHVDGIDTYYSYTKVRDYMCENNCSAMHGHEDINNTYTEPFGIPEESCHLIEFYSQDALGNTEDVQYQCVFVDHTPPVTNKTYSAPFFEEEGTKWITNMTNITLFAYDSEPHPSGVNRTYYRDVYLENETDWHYCYDNCSEWTQDARYGLPTAPEPYNPTGYKYTGLEESCHIIEYYSVDNVNKTETLNHQCVFVDNTAPIPDKKVGKPNSYCDNISGNCTWEWKVTTMTPIILSCDDQGPHPSDHSIVHWRVWWDRTQNWTEWNTTTEGTEIYLEEECLHQLEFYCTDAVGHESEKDLEWIKVEGGAFNITLNPKWNLISVPFVMTEDSIEEVFEDIADKVISVWTYDGVADEWYVYTPGPGTDTLTEMKPGWGYWVLMNTSAMEGNSVQLTIGGRLFSEAATPPSKKVVPGWNLIGYYGTDGELGYYGPNENGDPTYCALYSLIDTVIGNPRWSSLVTYWGPNNPPWKYMYAKNNMDAGAGYWMEIDVEDTYSFSTFCGRFSP
ncbi:MAG: YncE family protein [Candidatus Aenigmarchaeota archaeon]|nr:YncE family protein [Candidatus Aenigmarchaeota archaeon]